MVHRIRSRRNDWLISLTALALAISSSLEPVAGADYPGCRGANCPNCPVNSKYYGYYPTLWRRWPGTEPQPQPATPTTEGVAVPPVEPPPASEEIENKAKPPATETPGAAGPATETATEPAAVKPNVPPADDPNAKRPTPQQPEKGVLPAPTEPPPKLNRLPPNWRKNPAPVFANAPREQAAASVSPAEAWPPANILRTDEVRASFQLPDGMTPPKPTSPTPNFAPAAPTTRIIPAALPSQTFSAPPQSAAAPSQKTILSSSAAPITPQVDWRFDRTKPADAWHPDIGTPAGPTSPFADDRAFAKAQAASPTRSRQSLHWVDPTASSEPRRDDLLSPRMKSLAASDHRNVSTIESGIESRKKPAFPTFSADGASNGPADHCTTPMAEASPPPSTTRIPFVPRATAIGHLPPIDPRSLTELGTVAGVTPADVSTGRLAPPSKISEISAPIVPSAASQPLPTAKIGQENVLGIDPVAIGKSLEASKATGDFAVAPRGRVPNDVYQFADGIVPETTGYNRGPSNSSVAAARPSNAPSRTQFTASDLPHSQATSLFISDDDSMRGGVQPATYVVPSGPPQSPAGLDNPLRGGSVPSKEVLSTDAPSAAWSATSGAAARAPSGWSNPLRWSR